MSRSTFDDELSSNGLTRYHLAPPSWQLPLLASSSSSASASSSSAGTGSNASLYSNYAQFYPTRANQQEDNLSETVVKSGFVARTVVQTETFSAHQLIYEKLKGNEILPALAALVAAVTERQSKPEIAPSTFRLPSRVTLNEQKREVWVSDLANPAIPLSKLSRNIPHGYKGDKLLEMLFSRKVPISRATWYIRAIGGIEIQSQRNRAGFNLHQYTNEWTSTVVEFLRKQLAEIVLPSEASSLSVSTDSKGKGKEIEVDWMLDSASRDKWIAKFGYTQHLISSLYTEQLLDRAAFFRFLVDQLASGHFGQLSFVLLLIDDYLQDFVTSECATTLLVSACCTQLIKIESSTLAPAMLETTNTLSTFVRFCFISLPTSFVALPFRVSHSSRLEKLLFDHELYPWEVRRGMQMEWDELSARDAVSTQLGSEGGGAVEPVELEIIHVLDSITFPLSLSSTDRLPFHPRHRHKRLLNSSDLATLFTWATTCDRHGSHRVYAVATVILIELSHATAPGATHSSGAIDLRLEIVKGFIDWLDKGVEVREEVKLLLAELIRSGVVDYALYLQKMIARGETEEQTGKPESVHLKLLKTVALHRESGNLLIKRRMALRSPSEDRLEATRLLEVVENELASILDDNCKKKELLAEERFKLLLESLDQLAATGSHLHITRSSISEGVASLLSNESLSIECFSIIYRIFLAVKDYAGLLQFLTLVLRHHPARPLLHCVLDAVTRDLDTWTSLTALPDLSKALLSAYEALGLLGINDRRLIALLRDLGSAKFLDTASFEAVESNYQRLVTSLSSVTMQPQPLANGLPELQILLIDCSASSLTQLATTLWYRYHAYGNWGRLVLDTTLRLLPTAPSRSNIVLFLKEISERVTGGIEGELEAWIQEVIVSGSIVALLDGQLGTAIIDILGTLVLDGTISASALLKSLILPSWTAMLNDTSASEVDQQSKTSAIQAIITLLGSLMGSSDAGSSSLSDLQLCQRYASRRADLFSRSSITAIARCLSLIIHQQGSNIGEASDSTAMSFFRRVCSAEEFRMIVGRDPQALASAMLDDSWMVAMSNSNDGGDRKRILAGLMLALNGSSHDILTSLVSTEDWDRYLTGLTVWRLAISKVEVQACLEGLDLAESILADDTAVDVLHALSSHLLDRVGSGDGHTYLGEQVVKCYRGKASDELVSIAFLRLSASIGGLGSLSVPSPTRSASITTLRCTCRLLNALLHSGPACSRVAPLKALLLAIKACLESAVDDGQSDESEENVLLAAQMIEIALRCTPAPTLIAGVDAEIGTALRDCLTPIARLALVTHTASPYDDATPPLLLDTCSRLVFHLNSFSSTLRLPTLGHLLTPPPSPIVSPIVISRLSVLFPSPPPQISTSFPTPTPWELVDHADPPNAATTALVKSNFAPLSLHAFSARVVARIPSVTALQATTPRNPPNPLGSTAERGLQTNFDAETPCIDGVMSVAARDYRRTLVRDAKDPVVRCEWDPAKAEAVVELEEDDSEIIIGEASSPRTASSSTIPKVRSGSMRKTGSTSGTPATSAAMATAVSSTTRGTKRKESVLVVSDDEVVIVTKPRVTVASKRGRGATSAKTVGSRGAVGGKTVGSRGASRKKPKTG